MSKVIQLLGESLRKPGSEDTISVADAVASKSVLGLYFSAHWCPPCRGFTPKLGEQYTALKEAGKDFELVFVSSDKDDGQFKEYHDSMPFLALPFKERAAKEKLSKMFKVSGIPTLVFVDVKTGDLITDSGRDAITSSTFLEDFPYRPKSLMELLGDSLRKPGTEESVKVADAVAPKAVLGLYFSAHWCPPCRMFTPKLGEQYTALKDAGKDFELVFVSSDKDEGQFKEYHDSMPFLALPYEARAAKGELSQKFKVNGIPALVFVDMKTGKLITDEGRGAISSDTFLEDFPYHPKPVNDLSGSVAGINENVSLVVMMEGAPKEVKDEIDNQLLAIADAELKKPEEEQDVKRFFTGKEEGGITGQIRQMCKLKADLKTPSMVLLDLDSDGSFYYPKDEHKAVTPDNVIAFIKAFKGMELERQQMERG